MKENGTTKDGSAKQEHTKRLKERFKDHGLKGFNSQETLELLFALTQTGSDPEKLAETLLEGFGSIGGVLEANEPKTACTDDEQATGQGQGLNEDGRTLMCLIKGLSRAYGQERSPSAAVIKTKQDVLCHVNKAVPCRKGEILLAIYLNSKNEALGTWVIHDGPVTPETVSPRRAIEGALRHNGQGLIFVHRHDRPSADPTKQEARLIKGLWTAASAVDLIVHDHLIFSRLGLYSALEHGLITATAGNRPMAASPQVRGFRLNNT